MWQSVKKFIFDEEGATAVEYALIAALIAVAIIASLNDVSTALKAIFQKISDTLAIK